jgi:hypothetical protein
MAESMTPEPGSAEASFAAHIEAFHAGLPEDEQQLLEELFALAQAALPQQPDVQGFASDTFDLLALTGKRRHQPLQDDSPIS